jgi:hypothetical protein
LQPLPESLPLVDLARAEPYRSKQYTTVFAPDLTKDQLLQMARVIGKGFTRREPQARYLRLPRHPPAGFMEGRRATPIRLVPTGSVRGTRRRTRTGQRVSPP